MGKEHRMDELRADFLLGGSGKAGPRDSLTRQRVGYGRRFQPTELIELYRSNQFVQNIVDIPAEDLVRSWFKLEMKDDALRDKIMRKLRDLSAKERFCDARIYSRLHGDGFISIGAVQRYESGTLDITKPLREEDVKDIEYLHAFSSYKVQQVELVDDPFSPNYGKMESIRLSRISQLGKAILGEKYRDTSEPVHYSRVFHDQTRRIEGDFLGQSIIEPMWDVITVFDTALWSVGQILHDYTFKVYKSPAATTMSPDVKMAVAMAADAKFRAEALAIISAEESLDKVTSNVTGLNNLLDFVWDSLSGAAKMPKSVIKGQEAGTIAGAQYDVLNYYARIAAAQETELRPHLERLVRYILRSFGVDPDTVAWEIKFLPLWNIDQETDAKVRKLNAEADSLDISNGVVTEDEIRAIRYPHLKVVAPGKDDGEPTDGENDPNGKQNGGLTTDELQVLADAAFKRFRL